MLNQRLVIEKLELLIKHAESGVRVCVIDPNYGICWNLNILLDGCDCGYTIVEEYSIGWAHHTGSRAYPVPQTDRLWQGEGLALRVGLMKHIIKRLTEELEHA